MSGSSLGFLYYLTHLLFLCHVAHGMLYGDVMIDEVMAESGTNISVGCPGMSLNTFIIELEWQCMGQCGMSSPPSDPGKERSILKYSKSGSSEQIMESASSRVQLDTDMFGLQFNPVNARDAGKYVCLINNRPLPDALIQLNVLDVPDPPRLPIVMGFTSRSVSLSWSKPRSKDDSPIKGYVIRVGQRSVSASDDQDFIDIGRLSPYTVYNFQVAAMNHVGRSVFSKPSYPTITLLEKPSGKPRVTAAHNTSSTALYLSWQAPEESSIHGQFLGYVISYRPRDVDADEAQEVPLENPGQTEYSLTGLKVYTQYLVSIRVFNPEGQGPETIVVVMTDEGAPSSPRNPARANGVIQGYRIYFLHNNFTSVQTIRDNKSALVETLNRLKPYSNYKIWIKSYTFKNEGKGSEPLYVTTDVDSPGPPVIVNLTCQNGNTMFLKWLRPKVYFRTVDVYHVHYRVESTSSWDKQIVEAVNNTINHMMYLNNLTTNKVYDLKIQAGTRSLIGNKIMHFGPYSEVKRLLLQPGCEIIRSFSPSRSLNKENNSLILINLEEHLGMIAGVVCGSFGLLLALFLHSYYGDAIHKDTDIYYPNDKYYGARKSLETQGWDNASTLEGEIAIPVNLFSKHVAELHLNQNVGFYKEYEEIRAVSCLDEYSTAASIASENLDKNRYPNILAYDHTRVRILNGSKSSEKEEYINANYIDGFPFGKWFGSKERKFLVMITNLFENGKAKCDMYWPDAGSETYDDLVVTLCRQDVLSHYTLRTFTLRNLKANKKEIANGRAERKVYQYHYTAWPDHGVPVQALPLVSFIRNSVNANVGADAPILVHCSAGVGRSGCYIVLDSMMRQIESRGDINIFNFLKHIRTQRNHLVQTEEQYIFIHDALLEAIESGETHINKTNLPRYIHNLQCIDVTDEKHQPPKLLEKQFKNVSTYHPGKSEYSSALKICNQSKNRSSEFLALDSYRVYLNSTELDGSDYINASWIPGFFDLHEYILSQHPSETTLSSFWQMVWEQDVRLIVLLSSIDAQECCSFWDSPQSPGSIGWQINGYQEMKVTVLEDDDSTFRRAIRLSLEFNQYEGNAQNGMSTCSREVWIYHSPNWPQQCSPLSTVFDLIKSVDEELSRKSPNTGPSVIIDRYGATQAATFCCLKSLWHQLHFEGGVDVFQMAKLYHHCRPGIWRSQDEYLFMYCALEAYITNNGTTIPSPVDIDQWKNGFQLNGCIRVSRVYTDSVTRVLTEHGSMTESFRIPPDGQESCALLRHHGRCSSSTPEEIVHGQSHGKGICVPSISTNSTSSSTCSTAGLS
ncbi:PTPRG [Lepeophtheirus salmonis]|uniref:protein-tyrosine-phosphatase n=1 Tax=Lepeophtheirus salmonis TaxID=72036 RepID=A0A7R8CTP8_LEPSM|nr:PTPRG [Lepeophtheirus salmonis]CAF2928370.1 PTPRG [Lepeophtheirus salmonis]